MTVAKPSLRPQAAALGKTSDECADRGDGAREDPVEEPVEEPVDDRPPPSSAPAGMTSASANATAAARHIQDANVDPPWKPPRTGEAYAPNVLGAGYMASVVSSF
jgi:hypothetical protein